jgi:hypothetical protein
MLLFYFTNYYSVIWNININKQSFILKMAWAMESEKQKKQNLIFHLLTVSMQIM